MKSKRTVVTYKLYVGGMVYSGEPSYIAGIIHFVQRQAPDAEFTVAQVDEHHITIRTLLKKAGMAK